MSEPFVGEIIMFAGNFAPRGWALCQGQLLSIAQNTALFSILGTTYGGDGRTTFALPDLRGRAPIHEGTGPGLTPRPLGSRSGVEAVTLNVNQIPSHTHFAQATTKAVGGSVQIKVGDTPDSDNPEGAYLAALESDMGGDPVTTKGYSSSSSGMTLAAGSAQLNLEGVQTRVELSNTGLSQPHNNMQPYLAVNFIIALVGVFPSRN